jgi:hypothetical protein
MDWVAGRFPLPVLLIGSAVLLAGLDFIGAIAAKEWAEKRSWLWFTGGLLVFGLLFWTYGATLRYASLAVVTIAWVSLLQVALLLLDRYRYSVDLSTGKWVAVSVVLVLQGYLLLAPPSGGTGS